MKREKFKGKYIWLATIFFISIIFSYIVTKVNYHSDPLESLYGQREHVDNYELIQVDKNEIGTMVYSVGTVNKGVDNIYFVDMVEKTLMGYKWLGGGGHVNHDLDRNEKFLFSAQLLNENQNVIPTLFGVLLDEKISKITVTTKGNKSHDANIYNGRVEDEKFYSITFNENVSDYSYFIITITYKNGEKIEYVLSDEDEISKLQKGKQFYFYKEIADVDRDIYDGKVEKNQNTEQDLKEKEELINNFTQNLEDIQNRKVMYGDFIDDDHYVYVVTDQIDEQQEKILIVYLNDGNVECLFEGGDLDGNDQPIRQINKLFINRLENTVNPNVCVFRKNEKYTKVEIFEVNKKGKGIHQVGSCKRDNKTGEYIGEKSYKDIIDFSFPCDYCNELL